MLAFGFIGSTLFMIFNFIFKLRKMELEKKSGATDINQELAETIKAEFAKLRSQNEALNKRLEKLESINNAKVDVSQMSLSEINALAEQIKLQEKN